MEILTSPFTAEEWNKELKTTRGADIVSILSPLQITPELMPPMVTLERRGSEALAAIGLPCEKILVQSVNQLGIDADKAGEILDPNALAMYQVQPELMKVIDRGFKEGLRPSLAVHLMESLTPIEYLDDYSRIESLLDINLFNATRKAFLEQFPSCLQPESAEEVWEGFRRLLICETLLVAIDVDKTEEVEQVVTGLDSLKWMFINGNFPAGRFVDKKEGLFLVSYTKQDRGRSSLPSSNPLSFF